MGKVLEFRKIIGKTMKLPRLEELTHEVEDDISAIANDHSLTSANRRYLLENLLMDIDDRLEEYKREMVLAEQKLEAVVHKSELAIEAAYQEYIDRVAALTCEVRSLTRRNVNRES